MDRRAWQATVHRVAESDRTEAALACVHAFTRCVGALMSSGSLTLADIYSSHPSPSFLAPGTRGLLGVQYPQASFQPT